MTYDRARADVAGARAVPAAVGRAPGRSAASRRPSGGALFAARSGDRRLRVAGIGLAAAGLLMVIFSFFTWTAAADDGLSVSVTGMGVVTLEVSDERAQALGGATEATAELDKRSNSPGIVTAGLGALLIVSAMMLLINRYPGIGALVGAVPALIALFMSLEYLFAPGAAVLDGTGDAGIGFAAMGLWLVTVGASVAVPVSFYAVAVAMRGTPAPIAHKASDAGGSTGRQSAKSPVRAGDRTTAPRYLDHAPTAPRLNRTPGPRPEPGYRARSAAATDRMGRRPSENHLPHPGRQTPRPAPAPSPRYRPNQRASQDDSRGTAPIRHQVPNSGVDRGLPPIRSSRKPPPPVRRPPPDPREPIGKF